MASERQPSDFLMEKAAELMEHHGCFAAAADVRAAPERFARTARRDALEGALDRISRLPIPDGHVAAYGAGWIAGALEAKHAVRAALAQEGADED